MRILSLFAATALPLLLLGGVAHAVDIELYGQASKGLFKYDDGRNDDVVFSDNDYASTRLGVKGQQGLANGLTASVLFENEVQSNPSNLFTQNPNGGAPASNGNSGTPGTTTTFNERQARVGLSDFSYTNGKGQEVPLGSLYLGQQSTAIDGMRRRDVAGVTDVMDADVFRIGGGLRFQNHNGTGLSAISVNDLAPLNGDNREDSLRYDSPVLLGLQARASIAQGGSPELAAMYDGDYQSGFGQFKITGGLGYMAGSSNTGSGNFGQSSGTTFGNIGYNNRWDASLSTRHSSGFGGTLAYQRYETKTPGTIRTPESWYAKLGYAWADYEVAADYGLSDGFLTGELAARGLGFQYNMGSGVSAAALYRNFAAHELTTATDDINLYGVAMRVKF